MSAFTIPSIFTAIDKFSGPMGKMTDSVGLFERKMRAVGQASLNVAKKTAITGALIAAPLMLAANAAVEFEDKMADVAKTTGLQGQELAMLSQDILNLATTTRTSIPDIVKIAEIGGQLGIASKDLLGFIKSSNQFGVALGQDFGGGIEEAVTQIGKIKTLFGQTSALNIADAITRSGSAINELGAQGAGTSANIADFTLRMGALPAALKPSLTNTLALGTYLEEVGISAEIAAGGITRFLLDAGNQIPAFSKQMGMSAIAAQELLKTDPSGFMTKFAVSLNKLKPEQLAKKLKEFGIGSQESIKVLGALGTGTERLAALQKISSDAFAKGTSLQEEYNKKNATTRAQLEIVKNNMQSLSITIGTQLLPIVNDLLKKILPLIKGFADWAKDNPGTVKTILGITVAISALNFAISAGATILFLFTKAAMAVRWAIAAWTTAQYILNVVLAANPIGLVIIAIAALIALVVLAINKWNEWGAVLVLFLGPLGKIISLIQSFRRNWDGITDAFSNGGILAGIKKIGMVIYDALLMPMQQILKIIAKVTGADWATSAMNNLEKYRAGLGVNTTTDESGKPLLNNKVAEQDALIQRQESTNNAKVDLNINDPNNRVKAQSNSPFININTSSTVGAF